MVETLTYELALPSEAVRSRLLEAADRPTLRYWVTPGLTDGRPVIGEVAGDQFWWRLRHRERATFAPWLTGRIRPNASGTTVTLEFHSPLSGRVVAVVVGAVAAISLVWIATTPSPTATSFGLLALALLVLVGFPVLGTRMNSHEKHALLERFEEIMAEAIKQSPRADAAQART